MNHLIFDTETTGKADFRSPFSDPRQPRIVQLSAQLLTEREEVVAQLNTLIIPNGFEIPKEAEAIHGISTDMATANGIDIKSALRIFLAMSRGVKLVAYNESFDNLMLRSEFHRVGFQYDPAKEDCFCAMLAMTPICNLPPNFEGGTPKWPKLQEAYKHCFGEEFKGAHDATADVRACARVFFWLKQKGLT